MPPMPTSRGRTVLAALTLTWAAAGCRPAGDGFAPPDVEDIERAEVERVVRTLAADSMRGRRAFTDDALRAAGFIASEFEASGLATMPGADGYLQRFMVRSIRADQAAMSVNGQPLPPDRFVVRMGEGTLDWATGAVEPVVVGPDEADAQGAILGAARAGVDAVVFVHPAHAELFTRFSRFLGGPVRMLGDRSPPTVVLALTDAAAEASWEVSATAATTEEPLVNVVGMVEGRRPDEYVLFSAHYDHIGVQQPQEGDSIANGANDDASGTTAVVELARYFAARGTPERSLLFAAFTAEEAGGYGSRHFSEQLDPESIVAMFNIEMIGKPAVSGPYTAWITGFERSSFGPLLQEAVEGTEYEFYPDPYPDQNLFYRSDNATLARLGVPAHSISTTPIDVDPDYHRVSDHVETLDLEHMTRTIRAIATAAEPMIAGEATPTRVDPATVN